MYKKLLSTQKEKIYMNYYLLDNYIKRNNQTNLNYNGKAILKDGFIQSPVTFANKP